VMDRVSPSVQNLLVNYNAALGREMPEVKVIEVKVIEVSKAAYKAHHNTSVKEAH